MSSITRAEYDYADALFREYAPKRVANITFKTSDLEVIARSQRQFAQGDAINVNLPAWCGKAYVTKCNPIYFPDGHLECEVTLRPTGLPRRTGWAQFLAPIEALDRVREAARMVNRLIVDDPFAEGKSQQIIHGEWPLADWYMRSLPSDINCRCASFVIPKKERIMIRNKFYVASPSVTAPEEQNQDNLAKNVHLNMDPHAGRGKWTRKDVKDAVAHAHAMLEANPKLEHVAVVKIVKLVRRPKPKFITEDVK